MFLSMINILIGNNIENLKKIFFNIALIFKNSLLTAIALSLMSKKLKKTGINKKKNCKKLLFLERRIFLWDIEALNNNSEEIIFVQLSSRPIKTVFTRFLGKLKLHDYNYGNEIVKYKNEQLKIFNFWKKVIYYLKKILKFDGIISCNFIYSLQKEFTKASMSLGIPFFILFKEGLFPEKQLDELFLTYKNSGTKLNSKKMFVYNENIKDRFIQVTGFNSEQIIVSGVPRIDILFKKKKIIEEKLITLFFSLPFNKFKFFDENIIKKAKNILDNFYINFIKLSNSITDYKFIIKMKGNTKHDNYLNNLIKSNDLQLLNNIEISSSISPDKLIEKSRVVLSFSSTVLLEALALNKTIAEPDFGNIIPDGWGLFDNFRNATNCISDFNKLKDIILNYKKYKISENNRVKVLKHYLFSTDGNASERVNKELLEELKR